MASGRSAGAEAMSFKAVGLRSSRERAFTRSVVAHARPPSSRMVRRMGRFVYPAKGERNRFEESSKGPSRTGATMEGRIAGFKRGTNFAGRLRQVLTKGWSSRTKAGFSPRALGLSIALAGKNDVSSGRDSRYQLIRAS